MPDSVSRQYKNLENKMRKSPWKSKHCEFFEVIQHVENENRETQKKKGISARACWRRRDSKFSEKGEMRALPVEGEDLDAIAAQESGRTLQNMDDRNTIQRRKGGN
jgi:hypothetical protein